MAIPLDRLVLLAAGSATLLLAILVAATGIRHPLHRAFAALMGARAFALMLPQLGTSEQWTRTALFLQPYFALAVAPLAAYLLARGSGSRGRRSGWLALGVLVAVDALYALDHGLFHSVAPGPAAVGALRATATLHYTGFGPLVVVAALGPILLAWLGAALVVAYRRDPTAPDAKTWLLVAIGLLAGALFDGANRAAALADLLDGAGGFPWLPWGWAVLALPVAALLPALAGAAMLAADRAADPRPLHRLEGVGLSLLALAFASGFARLVAPPDSDVGGHPAVLVLLAAWRMATPVLVAVALLRRDHVLSDAAHGAPLGAEA